jgi:hypothetical protein
MSVHLVVQSGAVQNLALRYNEQALVRTAGAIGAFNGQTRAVRTAGVAAERQLGISNARLAQAIEGEDLLRDLRNALATSASQGAEAGDTEMVMRLAHMDASTNPS